jgi:hypothetical protein
VVVVLIILPMMIIVIIFLLLFFFFVFVVLVMAIVCIIRLNAFCEELAFDCTCFAHNKHRATRARARESLAVKRPRHVHGWAHYFQHVRLLL